MGAGAFSQMRRYVANAAYLSALFALVLTVATGLGCQDILTLMRTPSDIFAEANSYIFVIFMGIPVTFLYNLLAGILRSLGDSRTPVYFLALSSFLNIFLDFASFCGSTQAWPGPPLPRWWLRASPAWPVWPIW